MSISSTGLYGSATIVNSDLFNDIEDDIKDLSDNRIKDIEDNIKDLSDKVRGVYRFSSLVKQGKICFVIYIAGFFF